MTKAPFTILLSEGEGYQPLLSGEPQTGGMRSGRVYLKPGEACGLHSTGAHEEQLVILRGRGQALIGADGQDSLEVAAGQVAYIPPHTEHNIVNSGSEPLVYIYCVAPVTLLHGRRPTDRG